MHDAFYAVLQMMDIVIHEQSGLYPGSFEIGDQLSRVNRQRGLHRPDFKNDAPVDYEIGD